MHMPPRILDAKISQLLWHNLHVLAHLHADVEGNRQQDETEKEHGYDCSHRLEQETRLIRVIVPENQFSRVEANIQ